MGDFKSLKQLVQSYLRLRKIFNVFEFICLAALFIVFVYFGGDNALEILGCVVAVLIIPEFFLLICRSGIRLSIKDRNLLANANLRFYMEMKADFEKIRNDFISQGSKKIISDECKRLVWKEEMGIGWLSTKIKEFEKKCSEAEQIIKNLESIKKRLVIF